jgi:hypothetical protein
MRTDPYQKQGPTPILMRTESKKFADKSDPSYVRMGPIGTDVQSKLRTNTGQIGGFATTVQRYQEPEMSHPVWT